MDALKPNQYLQPKVTATRTGSTVYRAINLVNDHGISGAFTKTDLHDNHPHGHTMWLVQHARTVIEITLDLQGFYPIGEMLVWNYNQHDPKRPDQDFTAFGLKDVRIDYSVDAEQWDELTGTGHPYRLAKANGQPDLPATNLVGSQPIDFGGVTARYIKLAASAIPGVGNWGGLDNQADSFGLSKIRVYTGTGFAVIPDPVWTRLIHNKEGWTGGDGTFSVPMNGFDAPGGAATNTLFLFGDTLIGSIDPQTDQRRLDFTMTNNSIVLLDNSIPERENLHHIWGLTDDGKPDSVFITDRRVQNDQTSLAYYWPQDGLVVGSTFYNFPMTVMNDPEGPEGFQFKIDGVAMLVIPVQDGQLDIRQTVQYRTGLYRKGTSGQGEMMFGSNFLANTVQAGAPDPDGYIYVYGHKSRGMIKDLCVARTRESDIGDGSSWLFWTGGSWSPRIDEAAIVAENVSTEMSVTPLRGNLHQGRYMLVFQELVNSPVISYRIGDTPFGPFGEIRRLYSCPEPEDGRSIYAYNAKGHPHLSKPGELLVSYNVNSTSWVSHVRHGYIYGPRFIRLVEVTD